MRVYSLDYVYTHGTIEQILADLFVLTFNKKTHKHQMTCFDWFMAYKNDCHVVTFECQAHEDEFLAFHPDVKQHHDRFGRAIKWQAFDMENFPIELRRNRWCWKKPLTAAAH